MQITATDKQVLLEIPLGATLVEIANTGSNTVYRGWETTVSAAGDSQGVPLAAGNQIIYGGGQLPISGRTLRFICASGQSTTINYTIGPA